MINYIEEIADILLEAMGGDSLSREEVVSMIEIPQDEKMGDYAFPCFKLAKVLRKAPPLIAADIAESIQGFDLFEKVESVNAYVNMFISREGYVADLLKDVVAQKEDFGKSDVGGGKSLGGILFPQHCEALSHRPHTQHRHRKLYRPNLSGFGI